MLVVAGVVVLAAAAVADAMRAKVMGMLSFAVAAVLCYPVAGSADNVVLVAAVAFY